MAHNKLIIRIITCFYISRLIRFLIEDKKHKLWSGSGKSKFVLENVSKNLFMLFRFSLAVCGVKSEKN